MSKSVFITGGATGIGRAAVIKFLREGWKVAFFDINLEAGARLAGELNQPDQLLFLQGDTRHRDEVVSAVALAVERFGGLDAVFANAGIHQSNTLLDISDEELHRIVDINIYGSVHTLQAAVPELIKRGGGSVIINSSDQWFVGKPHSFAYGLTKGALGQITRSMSIDLAPYGIRVNAVCAGTIRTPLLEAALRRAVDRTGKDYDILMQEENDLYPRKRVGEPAEVANLVYFLASDQASFCTGAHYLCDGGLVAR